MKMLRAWNDLGDYGFVLLTGEACGVSARLLFDIQERAKKHLETFFGCELRLPAPWNASSNAVGSILLPYSIFADLAALVGLDSGGVLAIHVKGEGLWIVEPSDDEREIRECATGFGQEVVRYYEPRGTGHKKLRHVHVMSGREV